SHRQQQMGQLVLGQLIEEVRLVLPSIRAPQQLPAAGGRIEADSGVMAGGHGVRALVQRPVQQGAELDLPVAVNAGI
ncbi:YgiT-type zinc finger protein, partial [Dysosmobacter welbionis]